MSTENKETESTPETTIQAGALTQLLSQYRTDARLGHEQVSEALCLPVSSVKALENEEFDKLPEPPYVRGYLRSYSRLANKDAAVAINIYDKLHGGKTPTTAIYHQPLSKRDGNGKSSFFSESIVRLGVFILLLAVIGLISMQPNVNQWIQGLWASDADSTENISAQNNDPLPGESLINPKPIDSTLIDSKALAGDIPGNLSISDKPDPTKTPSSTTEEGESEGNEAQTEQADDGTVTTEEGSIENESENETNETNENETTSTEETIKLKLVFTNEAWIRIRDKNKRTVFQALNPTDSEKELTLSPPIKLRIGSASGVKIYINGEEKDITDHIKGNVANFNIE